MRDAPVQVLENVVGVRTIIEAPSTTALKGDKNIFVVRKLSEYRFKTVNLQFSVNFCSKDENEIEINHKHAIEREHLYLLIALLGSNSIVTSPLRYSTIITRNCKTALKMQNSNFFVCC